MRLQLVLATRSAHKVREIRAILGAAHPLVSLDEAGVAPDPAEDALEEFPTYRENALAKARFFANRLGCAVLADDSGLEVAALNGGPGVRTKRFAHDAAFAAGKPFNPGSGGVDVANNKLLLERLSDVADSERSARYVCAAALVSQGSGAGNTAILAATAIGTCSGTIARQPRGTNGFGYDPLFFLPDAGLTVAEIAAFEKHRRSHRARAFRALAATISEITAQH
jgi:XTP/dITP diphosphohydrolase